MRDIQASLANHAFEHLFIECLGWDRVRSIVSLDVNNAPVKLTAIAQKRGFTVFVARAHRTVFADRQLLRNVQRKIRKTHHEHILIHCCDIPCKQVWQWATTSGDGRPWGSENVRSLQLLTQKIWKSRSQHCESNEPRNYGSYPRDPARSGCGSRKLAGTVR